jgi:hypothetical protein
VPAPTWPVVPKTTTTTRRETCDRCERKRRTRGDVTDTPARAFNSSSEQVWRDERTAVNPPAGGRPAGRRDWAAGRSRRKLATVPVRMDGTVSPGTYYCTTVVRDNLTSKAWLLEYYGEKRRRWTADRRCSTVLPAGVGLRSCLDPHVCHQISQSKKKILVTSKCRHMYRVLNVDKIKN